MWLQLLPFKKSKYKQIFGKHEKLSVLFLRFELKVRPLAGNYCQGILGRWLVVFLPRWLYSLLIIPVGSSGKRRLKQDVVLKPLVLGKRSLSWLGLHGICPEPTSSGGEQLVCTHCANELSPRAETTVVGFPCRGWECLTRCQQDCICLFWGCLSLGLELLPESEMVTSRPSVCPCHLKTVAGSQKK